MLTHLLLLLEILGSDNESLKSFTITLIMRQHKVSLAAGGWLSF